MEQGYSIQRLLVLRKATRAIADLLRGQLKSYLSTLAPLLRPKLVFGDFVEGRTSETPKNPEAAFRELQALYDVIGPAKPFEIKKELKTPLEVVNPTLEMTVVEYQHPVRSSAGSKHVTVSSPLKWALSYTGFAPSRLRELLADRNRSADDLQRAVVQQLMLHVVLSKQTGVSQMLEALRFPVSSYKLPEFGNLPVSFISSSISTFCPPDDVVIESTEVSGMDAFEEIVNVDDVMALRDPYREKLVEIVRRHDADVR
jgi:hypothetical protein